MRIREDLYEVIAYRYDNPLGHSYVVYIGTSLGIALKKLGVNMMVVLENMD